MGPILPPSTKGHPTYVGLTVWGKRASEIQPQFKYLLCLVAKVPVWLGKHGGASGSPQVEQDLTSQKLRELRAGNHRSSVFLGL